MGVPDLKIGGKTVVLSTSVICRVNVVSEFKIPTGTVDLVTRVRFTDDKEELPAKVDISVNNGEMDINFHNWRNSLGATIAAPVSVARLANGQEIFMLAAAWAIGDSHKADLIFLVDGQ